MAALILDLLTAIATTAAAYAAYHAARTASQSARLGQFTRRKAVEELYYRALVVDTVIPALNRYNENVRGVILGEAQLSLEPDASDWEQIALNTFQDPYHATRLAVLQQLFGHGDAHLHDQVCSAFDQLEQTVTEDLSHGKAVVLSEPVGECHARIIKIIRDHHPTGSPEFLPTSE